jgi:hypothetical protein
METSSHASPGRVRACLDHPIEGTPAAGAVAAVRAEAGPAPVGR